ncbi:lactose transport system permease protein LacF [bacterium BMS3Abin02]|nr:lactose transport system permease protein LacF [bacterium BMS3Abin02]HDL49795.1 sugar ABC transporter permease [Actinomycetota bacterium]
MRSTNSSADQTGTDAAPRARGGRHHTLRRAGGVENPRGGPSRRHVSISAKRIAVAGAFLLPGVALFVTFILGPLLFSFRISFFDWNIIKPDTSVWVGLDNYARALGDPIFRRAVLNTIAYTVVTVPAQIIIGVGVAILLNQAIRRKGLFRVLYYLPVITPWVIVSLVFEFIFIGQGGLANYVLKDLLHVTQQNIRWLADPILTFVPIFLLGIWKGVGWVAIIALAGLQSIPREFEEAAAVDGAGAGARFRHITIPLIRPTLVFLAVVLTIGGLNAYISNLLITNGGDPLDKTHFILTLMYQATFTKLDFGYGAAISYLLTFFVLLMSVIQIRLLRRQVEL